jgi:hypothetical protein
MKLLPIAATASGIVSGSPYRFANIGDRGELTLGSQLQKVVGHGGRATPEV